MLSSLELLGISSGGGMHDRRLISTLSCSAALQIDPSAWATLSGTDPHGQTPGGSVGLYEPMPGAVCCVCPQFSANYEPSDGSAFDRVLCGSLPDACLSLRAFAAWRP